MGTNTTWLTLLKSAVRAFFKNDVVLHRDEHGMHVALADRRRKSAPRPASRAEKQAQKEQLELDKARQELADLLDEDATLRSAMRHLAFIEHALEKKGWRALYKVPPEVLERGLQQLESLVTNWSHDGLACLRSKMAVAVLDREHQVVNAEAEQYKTAAVLDNPPEIAAQAIEQAKASAVPEDESAALLATYAAMGIAPPGDSVVSIQAELGSPSAKGVAREMARQGRA